MGGRESHFKSLSFASVVNLLFCLRYNTMQSEGGRERWHRNVLHSVNSASFPITHTHTHTRAHAHTRTHKAATRTLSHNAAHRTADALRPTPTSPEHCGPHNRWWRHCRMFCICCPRAIQLQQCNSPPPRAEHDHFRHDMACCRTSDTSERARSHGRDGQGRSAVLHEE